MVVLLLLVTIAPSAEAAAFVVETTTTQSEQHSSYAAGMTYDAATDRIYVTGSTFGSSFFADETTTKPTITTNSGNPPLLSDCFVGILQLPTFASMNSMDPRWLRRRSIGLAGVSESCSAIATVRQGNDRKLYIAGHALFNPSLLADYSYSNTSTNSIPINGNTTTSTTTTNTANNDKTNNNNTDHVVVYGMVLDMTWYAKVNGGYLMEQTVVEYPVALVTEDGSGSGDVFVASLRSTVGSANPAYTAATSTAIATTGPTKNNPNNQQQQQQQQPDLTTAGGYLPPEYGQTYSLHLQRLGQRHTTANDLLTTTTTTTVKQGDDYLSGSGGENGTGTSSATLPAAAGFVQEDATTPVDAAVTSESFDAYTYIEESLVARWGREVLAATTNSVQLSSLLHLRIRYDDITTNSTSSPNSATTLFQNVLILAGSTRGPGPTIDGGITDISTTDTTTFTRHGFVTVLDADTGLVLRTKTVVSPANTKTTAAATAASTVRVLGLCHEQPFTVQVDSNSRQFIYIIGITDGYLDNNGASSSPTPQVGVFQAFLQKMEASTLQAVWTTQLSAAIYSSGNSTSASTAMMMASAAGSIHGMSCAVTPDGNQVYMAGTVLNGAAIVSPLGDGTTNATTSFGRDDMFVAQLEASDGSVRFIKQLGTSQDDRLATGEALVCDKYGNAILLGNTRGSFLIPEGKQGLTSDVVLLSVDRVTGNHVDMSTADNTKPGSTPEGQPIINSLFNPQNFNLDYIIMLGVLTTAVTMSLCLSLYAWRQRSKEMEVVSRYLRTRASIDPGQSPGPYDPEHAMVYCGDSFNDAKSDESWYIDKGDSASYSTAGETLREPPSLNQAETSTYKDTLLRLDLVQSLQGQPIDKKRKNAITTKNQVRMEDDESKRKLLSQEGDVRLGLWLKRVH